VDTAAEFYTRGGENFTVGAEKLYSGRRKN